MYILLYILTIFGENLKKFNAYKSTNIFYFIKKSI